MTFTYTPLGSEEFRLLRPVFASIQEISFRIEQVPRQYAPPHTAVSYTWGDDSPTEIIQLNGQPFRVRPNLWSCLYYLSLEAKRGNKWTHLWVDAICIDQTNNQERNAQVKLMDAIYRSACCVSVWLGLVPAAERYMRNSRGPIKTCDQEPFEWVQEMESLARRPYWSRFWIVQEFLLNEQVELYCSGNRIHWFFFQDILGQLAGIHLLSHASYSEISNAPANWQSALSLLSERSPNRHPEFLSTLHELLLRHQKSQCKDPRDRIFALLGLTKTEERDLLGRVFPDYTLSHDVVVIITFGHVQHFSMGETIDFEELFLALGIESDRQRKTLLQCVERLDYLSIDVGNINVFNDETRIEGDIDALVIRTSNEPLESTDTSVGSCAVILIPCVLSVLVGLWYFGSPVSRNPKMRPL